MCLEFIRFGWVLCRNGYEFLFNFEDDVILLENLKFLGFCGLKFIFFFFEFVFLVLLLSF